MTTYTNFSKDMWAAFKADARPGPLHMLNLIRLREEADYPDGRAASGEEAYREYSRTTRRYSNGSAAGSSGVAGSN